MGGDRAYFLKQRLVPGCVLKSDDRNPLSIRFVFAFTLPCRNKVKVTAIQGTLTSLRFGRINYTVSNILVGKLEYLFCYKHTDHWPVIIPS